MPLLPLLVLLLPLVLQRLVFGVFLNASILRACSPIVGLASPADTVTSRHQQQQHQEQQQQQQPVLRDTLPQFMRVGGGGYIRPFQNMNFDAAAAAATSSSTAATCGSGAAEVSECAAAVSGSAAASTTREFPRGISLGGLEPHRNFLILSFDLDLEAVISLVAGANTAQAAVAAAAALKGQQQQNRKGSASRPFSSLNIAPPLSGQVIEEDGSESASQQQQQQQEPLQQMPLLQHFSLRCSSDPCVVLTTASSRLIPLGVAVANRLIRRGVPVRQIIRLLLLLHTLLPHILLLLFLFLLQHVLMLLFLLLLVLFLHLLLHLHLVTLYAAASWFYRFTVPSLHFNNSSCCCRMHALPREASAAFGIPWCSVHDAATAQYVGPLAAAAAVTKAVMRIQPVIEVSRFQEALRRHPCVKYHAVIQQQQKTSSGRKHQLLLRSHHLLQQQERQQQQDGPPPQAAHSPEDHHSFWLSSSSSHCIPLSVCSSDRTSAGASSQDAAAAAAPVIFILTQLHKQPAVAAAGSSSRRRGKPVRHLTAQALISVLVAAVAAARR